MSNKINIEEIERFLEGKMEESERSAFERRMAEDTELTNQVEIVRDLDGALEDKDALNVFEAIQGGADEYFKAEEKGEEKPTAKVIRFNSLQIAASIAFLAVCVLLIWWRLGDSQLTNQELYASYYETYQVDDVNRSDGTSLSLIDEAQIAYTEENYIKSAELVEEILINNPGDNQALYILGHSKLNQFPPEITGAIESFKSIAIENRAIESDDSKWYLALIYLKQDDVKEAKKWLQQLENSENSILKSKASELLQKLQ